MLDVSVIIRTKNEAEFIEKTMTKVEEQHFCGHYEVIVVDSGSTDSTLDIVKRHDVKLLEIPQKEFTYGHSLNIASASAKGKFVVNLSAHALPRDSKWLANLVDSFEEHDVAGIYGRQLSNGRVNPFEALQNEIFFGCKKTMFNLKNKKMLKHMHFSNSNCAIRKDVWQRFKFNYCVPYAEDRLWQREVIEAGFSIVYAPDAAVYHTHEPSIYRAYKCSKDCAYALALMKQKRQSVPLIIFDVGIFLGLIPHTMFQNIRYVWRNNYLEHLTLAPFYVMSGWLGWLVGRINHRLKK